MIIKGDEMTERGLPPQVLTEIESPVRETRLTGVDELARLVTGADLAMAAAARLALMRLTEDDSRSVAAAAAAALERTSLRLSPDALDFGQIPPGVPQLVADVLVEGPPLAVATATVTVSGPGLRAMLLGRRLRVAWQPRSHWLDGLVTVRGPAGWADVRVTGQASTEPSWQVADPPDAFNDVGELRTARLPVGPPPDAFEDIGELRTARLPVVAAPPARRRVGVTVLIAGLSALVLLGGVSVAVSLTRGEQTKRPTLAAPVSPLATTTSEAELPAPSPATISRVPLARRVASADKPTVVGTIRVGAEPEGVAVAADGRTVYVANQSSRFLSVVDSTSRRVTSVKLRNTPRFVAASRDGSLVFVSMYEDDKSGSGVAVVDTTGKKPVRYLASGVQPFALAVCPDGRVWVPIHGKGRIEIYSATGQRTAGQITVPANPHAVAFSSALMLAFTANHESNAVAIIDIRTDKLLKSIPVSRAPHSVAVSPDGRTVLVAGYEANTADLIDAVTQQRTGPFKVGRQPQSVAFATDGKHAYVVNEGDNTVSVLNGRTGAVTATIGVGRSPRTIAVSPDGRLAYVTNGDDNTISVLKVGE